MKFDWYRLFHPRFWFGLYKTNWDWDIQLNKLLDNHEPTNIDRHACDIGPATVWISNYPYAYARPYPTLGGIEIVPSAKTRDRLRRIVTSSQHSEMAQKENAKWVIVKEWK